MGPEIATNYQPAAHYDHVHSAWRLIMGEEFHYGFFAVPETPLELATAALTDQMLVRAGIRAGDRVLDVGCGTGRQACDLAASLGATVLGITTSAGGVAAARALASGLGLDGARFEQRDGTDNGLPVGAFDVAWVLESSHLMRDRRALLSECARVLAPGGGSSCATSSADGTFPSPRSAPAGRTSPRSGRRSVMRTWSRSRATARPWRSSG